MTGARPRAGSPRAGGPGPAATAVPAARPRSAAGFRGGAVECSPSPEAPNLRRPLAWTVLGAALLLVSTAGPFIRLSRIDAFALVLLRMSAASALFLAVAAATGTFRTPGPHLPRLALGGVFLAGHFLLWIKAFDLTSYASNLLLLIAQPVCAALLGSRIGERPGREAWTALVLGLLGLGLIARGDFELGGRALLGDLCSVLGGLSITLFYVVSRHARKGLPIASFMGWTLLVGAAAALPVVLVTGVPLHPSKEPIPVLGWTPTPWVWLAGLVLVTTMGGHGLMNVAARHVRLFTVNIVIVLEPVLAILLGVAFLGEPYPTGWQWAGGALLAASVVVALLPERRAGAEPEAPPGIAAE